MFPTIEFIPLNSSMSCKLNTFLKRSLLFLNLGSRKDPFFISWYWRFISLSLVRKSACDTCGQQAHVKLEIIIVETTLPNVFFFYFFISICQNSFLFVKKYLSCILFSQYIRNLDQPPTKYPNHVSIISSGNFVN